MGQQHLTDEEIQTILDNPSVQQKTGIQKHLNSCKKCLNLLHQYQRLSEGLKKAEPDGHLPANFAKSVISRLPKENASPFKSPSGEVYISIFGILIAVGASFIFLDLDFFSRLINQTKLPVQIFNFSFLTPIKDYLATLNGGLVLLPFAGLALLLVGAVDHFIIKRRHHKLSV